MIHQTVHDKNHQPSKAIVFVIPIILMVVFTITLRISQIRKSETESVQDEKISQGLQEIKVSFAVGDTFEVTELTNLSAAIILRATELSEEENILLPEAASQVLSSTRIANIEFPPINENSFAVVDNSDKIQVEEYFRSVYTIFSENVVDISLEGALIQIQSGDKKYIEELIQINERLYRRLITTTIPKDAIKLHKQYLRLAQVQHHFLLSISRLIEDPIRVTIDTELVKLTLEVLNESIRQDIRILGNQYQLQFDRNI